MMTETELKEAERRTYLSYFEDGIGDIVGGLVVLLFGLGMTFDSSTFFIFSWMPVMFFWPIKRAVTFPRIGYVRFRPERQRKISRNMILLLVAGSLSFLLGLLAFFGVEGNAFDLRALMLEYAPLVFGVVMAAAFVLVAALFEVARFYAYGAIVFLGWLAAYLFEINEGIPVAIAGGLISLAGFLLLVRFLNKYPVASE